MIRMRDGGSPLYSYAGRQWMESYVLGDPRGWYKLNLGTYPYGGKPFGYRDWDSITIDRIWTLWLDEMLPLFQAANTALRYPGECRVRIPTEAERRWLVWKTYPCPEKISAEMAWAGFSVAYEPPYLVGGKK